MGDGDTVTITLPLDVAQRICEWLDGEEWDGGRSESDLLWVVLCDALDVPLLDGFREKVRAAWGL